MIKITRIQRMLIATTFATIFPLTANSQFYLLADIGNSANTDYSFTEVNSPAVTNDTNYTSYRLGVGYIAPVSEKISIGAEAAYNSYGSSEYHFLNHDHMDITFKANDILVVSAYQFNEHWEAHVKAGAAYEEVNATEDHWQMNLTEKEWVPEAAIGARYFINEHFAIHADLAYLMGWESQLTNMPDITVGWLGVNYYF